MQEQPASSKPPPDYEGCITVDPTLLDQACLYGALEAGSFELNNMQTNQNLVLHHIAASLRENTVFLWELMAMARRPYRSAILEEISWRDLQWLEVHCWGVVTQEEVVEDEVTGKVTTLLLPVDCSEDAPMEESSDRHLSACLYYRPCYSHDISCLSSL